MIATTTWTLPSVATEGRRQDRQQGSLVSEVARVMGKDALPSGHLRAEVSERAGGLTLRIANEDARKLGREDFLLLGAMLANAHLALRRRGLEWKFTWLSADGRGDNIARLTPSLPRALTREESLMWPVLSPMPPVVPGEVPLADALPGPRLLAPMQRAIADTGAWVDSIDDGARRTLLADIVAYAARVARGEREMWALANRYGAGARVAPDAGARLRERLTCLGGNHPCVSDADEVRVRRRILNASMALVLGAEDDTALSWMRTGLALQRLLLLGTAAGLGATVHTEVARHVAPLEALRALTFAGGRPQLVLRFAESVAAR